MIRNRLLGLFIAAAVTVGGMATVSTAGASAAGLTGAGSTLVAPLMANWISGFEIKEGIPVKYGAVGSGAGIAQITARTVDFGASDAPLTPEQAAACNGCVQIPWALSATGLGFNVPGVKKLNLTGNPRRHLLRQGHQLERPEDQAGQPGRETAEPGDHPGLPQRRLRRHLRVHQLPLQGQQVVEERSRLRDLGRLQSTASAPKATPASPRPLTKRPARSATSRPPT